MLDVKDVAVTSSTLLSEKDLNDEHSLPEELLRKNIQYLGKVRSITKLVWLPT